MNERIVFFGTPEFAEATLNALWKADMDVVAVVTAPDRPAGRGRQLRMSAVKQRAMALGLPILQPTNLKAPSFLQALQDLEASLFIVVAFRMLPRAVWEMPRLGTINLHASLLPDYRGAAPINWAIINGEERTGATTFFINERIDTGDILLKLETPIGPNEHAGQLHDRLMGLGAELMVRTIEGVSDRTIHPIAQPALTANAKTAPKLDRSTCRVDWTRPASTVHDLIRGLSPYPGAWTLWREEGLPERQLKILAARPEQGDETPPGKVVFSEDGIRVACGQGMIRILELQMEGKRAMPTAEFLRGLQQLPTVQLE